MPDFLPSSSAVDLLFSRCALDHGASSHRSSVSSPFFQPFAPVCSRRRKLLMLIARRSIVHFRACSSDTPMSCAISCASRCCFTRARGGCSAVGHARLRRAAKMMCLFRPSTVRDATAARTGSAGASGFSARFSASIPSAFQRYRSFALSVSLPATVCSFARRHHDFTAFVTVFTIDFFARRFTSAHRRFASFFRRAMPLHAARFTFTVSVACLTARRSEPQHLSFFRLLSRFMCCFAPPMARGFSAHLVLPFSPSQFRAYRRLQVCPFPLSSSMCSVSSTSLVRFSSAILDLFLHDAGFLHQVCLFQTF